jgi:hypothetical protein
MYILLIKTIFKNNNKITYLYAANGIKLKKEVWNRRDNSPIPAFPQRGRRSAVEINS